MLRGKEVDKKKLRRFIKDTMRKGAVRTAVNASTGMEYPSLPMGRDLVFGQSL
jgi:hypothetical protein